MPAICEAERVRVAGVVNENRNQQIGCGQRGDKIRTTQVHHGTVKNHLTGRKLPVAKYLKGFVDLIQ